MSYMDNWPELSRKGDFFKFELNKVEETPTIAPIVSPGEYTTTIKIYGSSYPLGTVKVETVSLLTTGENVVREKYGEITLNPPLYPGHNNPE